MNYFPLHIGDYLKDTAHLSLLEHGVYFRVLHRYYNIEGGIPEGDVARHIGVRTKDEKAALAVVLSEFFTLEQGVYRQARCEREINLYLVKQAKARASAEARWGAERPHSDRNANAPPNDDASGMRTHIKRSATRARSNNQSPNTNNQTRFAEFWSAWPKSTRKGSKSDCAELWAAQRFDGKADEILAHVVAMSGTEGWRKSGGEFVPAPLVYLRGHRWDGAEIANGQLNGSGDGYAGPVL